MPVYECDGCGACCQGLLLIEVYELDLLREPRLQTVDPRHAGRSRADSLDELSDPDRCLIIAGCCPFLSPDKRCSIYPTRPNACVAMAAGDEQCQQVRRDVGLPPLAPLPQEPARVR